MVVDARNRNLVLQERATSMLNCWATSPAPVVNTLEAEAGRSSIAAILVEQEIQA